MYGYVYIVSILCLCMYMVSLCIYIVSMYLCIYCIYVSMYLLYLCIYVSILYLCIYIVSMYLYCIYVSILYLCIYIVSMYLYCIYVSILYLCIYIVSMYLYVKYTTYKTPTNPLIQLMYALLKAFPYPAMAYLNGMTSAFYFLAIPATSSLLAAHVSSQEVGFATGTLGSIRAITGVFGPLVFSQMYSYCRGTCWRCLEWMYGVYWVVDLWIGSYFFVFLDRLRIWWLWMEYFSFLYKVFLETLYLSFSHNTEIYSKI